MINVCSLIKPSNKIRKLPLITSKAASLNKISDQSPLFLGIFGPIKFFLRTKLKLKYHFILRIISGRKGK